VVTETRKLAGGQLQFNVASVNSNAILNQIALAKATEDRSLVSFSLGFPDSVADYTNKTPVVNVITWKFEPDDVMSAKVLARSEVKLATKNDPFRVMFVNQHDLEFFRPAASDIKG
jgi:hypothetical protein